MGADPPATPDEEHTLVDVPKEGALRTTDPEGPADEPPAQQRPAAPDGRPLGVSPPTPMAPPGASPRETDQDAGIDEVLSRDEAARARAFALALGALIFTTLTAVPFLGGSRSLVLVVSTSLTALACVCAWVAIRAGRGSYDRSVFRVFTVACVLGAQVALVYLGVFSPTPLVVTLGVSFFATGADRGFAVGGSVVAAVCYGVLAALMATGAVPDPGRFSSLGTSPQSRAFMVVMVPAVLLLTTWVSHRGRRTIREAMREAQKNAAVAREREAQLLEVERDLDAVLAGAGKGRFTGTTLGEFRIAELIGRGGMGDVYAAKHLGTSLRVAMKLLHHDVRDDAGIVERFRREARVTASLRSPHVVSVLDADVADDGTPYLAMELLEGQDLSRLLRQRGRLGLDEVSELVDHVAEGLSLAHAAGVVHRDLKPQNLFRAKTRDGEVWKVLDFGVSKLMGSSGTLTQRNVVGTPGYMSPEQARGLEADARSDVFSLAAVAYRALTGRPPFSGKSPPELLLAVLARTPQRPGALVSGIPRDVDLVLALGLAKDPDRRIATVLAFRDAFRDATVGALSRELSDRARRELGRHAWGSSISDTAALDPKR